MRIEEALERFLVQLEADGRSEHTRSQYRRHIRLLACWAHDVRPRCDRIEALDDQAVARFLAARAATVRPDGRAKLATSVNALRTSLKVFLAYCHKAGLTVSDPGRLIRRAITSPPPPRSLSDDEERRLLAVLKKADGFEARRDEMLVRLMLATGLRVGSALALEVGDVDLERGEISIHAKGGRRERVFLSREIRKHLKRYLARRTTGPIFATQDGRQMTRRHAERRFRMWVGRAGIRKAVSPHSCRHRFAMALYARTHDLLLVREALCHRSISSTMIYARCDADRLREILS